MTVREWVTSRSTQVPDVLTARVIELLGADADQPASGSGAACLAAAQRSLEQLLASGRYERDSALDLLAVDALTTFAFEHAAEASASAADIKRLAMDGARALSGIAAENG
ncbi:MAG: hypothetical protein AABZ80_01535 [Gemmatimonadota bacterium]